jgi:hypothetical protein
MIRTFDNCMWAERRMHVSGGLWRDGWRERWYCLALSERADAPIEVEPPRCAACWFWKARPEQARPNPVSV